MSNRLVTPMKARLAGHALSLPVLGLPGLGRPGASAAGAGKARRVEHRNGAGHLDPAYEAELRARVQDRARKTGERAFVSRTSSPDATAEEAGEEFVMTVTSGENGESADAQDSSDERGGPFVETNAGVEFAYDTDESNPADATREPFPIS